MKKNIGYYNLSPESLQWLKERLCKEKEEKHAEKTSERDTEGNTEENTERTSDDFSQEREELCRGIRALCSGNYDVLSLAKSGNIHAEQAYLLENPQNYVLRCGQLEIDPRARRVLRSGKEISLTPKEFDILYFLMENRGIVYTKEQIYEAVWRGDYLMDDSNIMAFIRKLRKKIEPNPDAPEYILTVWGIGYKMNEDL